MPAASTLLAAVVTAGDCGGVGVAGDVTVGVVGCSGIVTFGVGSGSVSLGLAVTATSVFVIGSSLFCCWIGAKLEICDSFFVIVFVETGPGVTATS